MIVVDVSTIAYLWIPGDLTSLAERALARDPHWVSSILWRSELRNVLAGYLRGGRLPPDVAGRCLAGAESQMAGREFVVPSALVMAKVTASSCSAYDCEYVALAADMHVPLVTSDRQILDQFPGVSQSLRAFAGSR
jgi:predicted nucleic acid-binding protein